MAKHNQRGYKFYVSFQTTGGRCIESGWEYREDAQDRLRDARKETRPQTGEPKVLTRRGLMAVSPTLDPENQSAWCWQDSDGRMRLR